MMYLRSGILGVALILMAAACSTSDSDTEAPSSDAGLIATGQFASRGGQETSGTYRLERVGEYRRLLLADDFQTSEGPDLHVVLSPTSFDAADDDNAVVEGAAVIDTLSALQGKQVFYLSDSLDMSRFQSVLIHCVEFTHLYGAAPLESTGARTSR